jgi:hypothetical protein
VTPPPRSVVIFRSAAVVIGHDIHRLEDLRDALAGTPWKPPQTA